MTRRKIENKIESLEQEQADDGFDMVVVDEDDNPREKSKSVENGDLIITISDATYATWAKEN